MCSLISEFFEGWFIFAFYLNVMDTYLADQIRPLALKARRVVDIPSSNAMDSM